MQCRSIQYLSLAGVWYSGGTGRWPDAVQIHTIPVSLAGVWHTGGTGRWPNAVQIHTIPVSLAGVWYTGDTGRWPNAVQIHTIPVSCWCVVFRWYWQVTRCSSVQYFAVRWLKITAYSGRTWTDSWTWTYINEMKRNLQTTAHMIRCWYELWLYFLSKT